MAEAAAGLGVVIVGMPRAAKAGPTDQMALDGHYDLYPTGETGLDYINPLYASEYGLEIACTRDCYKLMLAANYGQDEYGVPIPGYNHRIRLRATDDAGHFRAFAFGSDPVPGAYNAEIWSTDCELVGETLHGRTYEQEYPDLGSDHFLRGKPLKTTIEGGQAGLAVWSDAGHRFRVRHLVSKDCSMFFMGTYGYCNCEIDDLWIVDFTRSPIFADMNLGAFAHSSGRWAVRNSVYRSDVAVQASPVEGGFVYFGTIPDPLYNGADVELIGNDVVTTSPLPNAERYALASFSNGVYRDPSDPVRQIVRGNRVKSCLGLIQFDNNAITRVLNNDFEIQGFDHFWGGATGISVAQDGDTEVRNNRFRGDSTRNYTAIECSGNDGVIANNDFSDCDLPGWKQGNGCIVITGSRVNVNQHARLGTRDFPDGTTMCDQILDLGGGNTIRGWDMLCDGDHPQHDRLQDLQQRFGDHKAWHEERKDGDAPPGGQRPASWSTWSRVGR